MLQILATLGRHGRWVLPAGLLAGALLPEASDAVKPWIGSCIGALIFIACMRVDVSAILGKSTDDGQHHRSLLQASMSLVIYLLVMQLALPVFIALLVSTFAMSSTYALPAVLVAAAAPLSGGPAMVVLLRGDATLALKILIIGTACLPLTCLPALALLDNVFDGPALWSTAVQLLMLIAGAMLLATICRHTVLRHRNEFQHQWLDGLASLLLAFVVVGLMSGLHAPDVTLRGVLGMLAFALALNLVLQLLGWGVGRWIASGNHVSLVFAVLGGNRNIALFLTALPIVVIDDLMLFIACYQVPMYLTPLIGRLLFQSNLQQA